MVRRAFFAMSPETAHRAAQLILGLPLPWARIGGAVEDPALATDLAGIDLPNPIGLAAGFDKTCRHLDALGSLGFGYVVGGTITRAPRSGNPRPRIHRYPDARSMTNAMGLPNPGAEAAAVSLSRLAVTSPRFASVADEEIADAVATATLLAPHVAGIELNASCPNVSWGRDRDQEAHLRTLVSALVEAVERPLFVKLPPIGSSKEADAVLALAAVAQEAGAAGLTCGNTRLVGDERLAATRGGLSGRALWPRTVETVAAVRTATADAFPINACGGIFTAGDAVACLDAGATTVQIYTSFIFEGPAVVGRLAAGVAAHRGRRGLVLPSP